MDKKQIILRGKSITFYSPLDEAVFGDWIKNISCLAHVERESDDVLFYVNDHSISPLDLDRLVGLFARYAIDTKQLHIFLNDQNKEWLKYWL